MGIISFNVPVFRVSGPEMIPLGILLLSLTQFFLHLGSVAVEYWVDVMQNRVTWWREGLSS